MKQIIEYWELIIGGLTGASGLFWGYTQKKLKNKSDIRDIYQKDITYLNNRLETLQKQMVSMEERIKTLHEDNMKLRTTNFTLRKEIKEMKNENTN